jgi:hypothetical protein
MVGDHADNVTGWASRRRKWASSPEAAIRSAQALPRFELQENLPEQLLSQRKIAVTWEFPF